MPGPTLRDLRRAIAFTVHLEHVVPRSPRTCTRTGFHVSPERNQRQHPATGRPHRAVHLRIRHPQRHGAGLLLVPPARAHARRETRSSAAWPTRWCRRGDWTRSGAERGPAALARPWTTPRFATAGCSVVDESTDPATAVYVNGVLEPDGEDPSRASSSAGGSSTRAPTAIARAADPPRRARASSARRGRRTRSRGARSVVRR